MCENFNKILLIFCKISKHSDKKNYVCVLIKSTEKYKGHTIMKTEEKKVNLMDKKHVITNVDTHIDSNENDSIYEYRSNIEMLEQTLQIA